MNTGAPHPEDESLLVAALGGDDRAFGALESRFQYPLRQLARRWSPGLSRDLRDEIVQEVWTAITIRRARVGVRAYDPRRHTPISFIASFVPNAAQRIRSVYRAPGTVSRPNRRRVRSDAAPVPRAGWNAAPPLTIEELERVMPDRSADNSVVLWDSRIDLSRAVAAADAPMALAIQRILVSGLTLFEAAAVSGLSATTFSRRLSQLAPIAA